MNLLHLIAPLLLLVFLFALSMSANVNFNTDNSIDVFAVFTVVFRPSTSAIDWLNRDNNVDKSTAVTSFIVCLVCACIVSAKLPNCVIAGSNKSNSLSVSVIGFAGISGTAFFSPAGAFVTASSEPDTGLFIFILRK